MTETVVGDVDENQLKSCTP